MIDWEFAGMGWREYDLAWALRARTVFLNTPEEREALLNGYRSHASFDGHVLRWCEVLNYLHFAYWARERRSEYASFALDRAREICRRKVTREACSCLRASLSQVLIVRGCCEIAPRSSRCRRGD